MQFKEKKKKTGIINITSLIDVMFILLIFFMVSSTFVEQPGMKLELPSVQSQETVKVDKLVMSITSDGAMVLGEQKVTLENLGETISSIETTDQTLILKADKATEHGLIVQIMDIAKRNGMKKIVIGTRVGEK